MGLLGTVILFFLIIHLRATLVGSESSDGPTA
jgi:hypothetical protein